MVAQCGSLVKVLWCHQLKSREAASSDAECGRGIFEFQPLTIQAFIRSSPIIPTNLNQNLKRKLAVGGVAA